MSRFFTKRLEGLAPYVPGEQPKIDGLVKLNTNENPYDPCGAVRDAGLDENLKCYPDPECGLLVDAIRTHYRLPAGTVMVGNGSDELLGFAFLAYGGPDNKMVFPQISYGFYPVFGQVFQTAFREIPLKGDLSIDPAEYRDAEGTIIIANPNAPTGIALSRKEMESILQSNPDRLVIVDEAYVDFGGESCIPLIDEYDNLLVIQTFSKSRSLAGCRVGFAVSNREIIGDLNRIKYSFNPYNLDRLAIKIATEAILDVEYFEGTRQKIIATREWLFREMTDRGFVVTPSKANFLFTKPPQVDGRTYFQRLREKGILVRHFDKPEIEQFVRITIGTREDMAKLLKATDEILKESAEGEPHENL